MRAGDPSPDLAVLDGIDVIVSPTEDHANPEFRQACFPILDSPEYWPHNVRILPGMVRRTLETIARARPGILIHCGAGRDRTGMITTLLLANAGVAPEVIADDYAESVRAMAGAQANLPTQDRQSLWNSSEVADWLGQVVPLVMSFAAEIDRHMRCVGLGDDERNRLRSLLLTD